jgi:hypothetical protein
MTIKQTLMEADQMVLLPLTTVRPLQNEIAELEDTFLAFKEDTQNQPRSLDDALRCPLAFAETESSASDDEDFCMDRVAQNVAAKRVHRLGRDHNSSAQRAHLEFMADIVGVEDNSKVDICLFQPSTSSTNTDRSSS